MNFKTLRQILFKMSKRTLHAMMVNIVLISTIYASGSTAQSVLSVKEASIELRLKNVDLFKVLDEIEYQTDYEFSYKLEDLDSNIRISGNFKNAKVSDVLFEISKQASLKFRQVNNSIHISRLFDGNPHRNVLEIEIEDIEITGKVTDKDGLELPGVSILEKGTSNGTVTDLNGNFNMKANSAGTLVFSFVGYIQQEIAVSNNTKIDIQLDLDTKQLEEIVVVGYGTQKRSEVTNAVVQASGEDIKRTSAVSLSNSLAGRLAGLYVNQTQSAPGFDDAEIVVRGYNTYRNNAALIVIDGVANADPDGLNRLDPNDIESISVLKDASAAIYGAQSAGGVILVTTKRGNVGKPVFNYTARQGFESPTSKVKTADALQYMEVLNSSRALDAATPDFPDELISGYQNGTLRSEDWWDALVGGPVSQFRHSLTMRGGTEKVRYFASVGTVSQGGILVVDEKTKLKQYNVRTNLDVAVTENFEVGLDLSFRRKDTKTPQSSPGGDLGAAVTFSPLREAFIDQDIRYPGEGWSHLNPAARAGVGSPGYRNYLSEVTSGTFRYKYQIPAVKGLSLEGFASVVKSMWYNKEFNYVWDYYEKNSAGEIVKKTSRSVEDIGLRESFDQSQRVTLNTKLAYSTTINENHNISAFVAYEQMEYEFNNFWAQRLGFDSPQIDQLFAGSTDRSNWNNSGSAEQSSRKNYFGRATYDFKSKYLIGLNFRYDGSPIFPKESRFGFFPGVSMGWLISEESFVPDDLFSHLKLRASWGKTGNDRVDPFQYVGSFGYARGYVVNGSDVRGIAASSTPNPNITWEVSTNSNIGLEMGFLDGKLDLEVDVFKITTSDILGRRQASIPAYTGLSLPDENIGEMENKGIEFQASYRTDFGDVTFRTSGNFSYAKNKIVYFDEVPQAEPYQKLEGRPLGSDLVYKAIGIYRSQDDLDNNVNYNGAGLGNLIFADLNNDGEINSNDRYRYEMNWLDGKSYPKAQFGLNLGADYKGFDFTVLFQGQAGAKWRLDNGFSTSANGNGLSYVAENSFSLENTNAELPRVRPTGTGASNSDFYYHDLFWMRIKSLELGYSLPGDLVSKVGITGFRVYFSGQNLLMLANSVSKFGIGDPEFTRNGKGAQYPNMKTLSFGLSLTF